MRKEVAARYYDCDRIEMLPFVPDSAKRILELGCARGAFSLLIKQRQSAEVWGVELNPEAAAIAATRLDKVITGDIFQVLEGLPEHYFDCVICNDILEHLPAPENILVNLKKHLAPAGVVVASIPNMRYLPVLYELLIRKDWRYRDSGVLDRTHLRFFTRKSICRLFESAGYRTLALQGLKIHTPLIVSFIFFLVNILTLGYYNDTRFIQYACVAEKPEK
jgi:2-polyprenyl-3-methyl-5-hydroxy-6-metoxy-1,4-benzoquinol methylase